jgi:hypothetical protein
LRYGASPTRAGRRHEREDKATGLTSLAARFAAPVIERPGEFAGRRPELASDEVTGPQAARILSEVLHRPIAHSRKILRPQVPMAPFFR